MTIPGNPGKAPRTHRNPGKDFELGHVESAASLPSRIASSID